MESLPELFVQPGRLLPEPSSGTRKLPRDRRRCRSPAAQRWYLESGARPPHGRGRGGPARLPRCGSRSTAFDGVILRIEESVSRGVTRDAAVTSYQPDGPLPPSAFEFNLPSDTTFIY